MFQGAGTARGEPESAYVPRTIKGLVWEEHEGWAAREEAAESGLGLSGWSSAQARAWGQEQMGSVSQGGQAGDARGQVAGK